jgi:cytochrome b subunit of formate dehydrogenase
MMSEFNKKGKGFILLLVLFVGVVFFSFALSQEVQEEYETIESDACIECHERSEHDTVISDDISHSTHDGLECLDCHGDKGTMPHKKDLSFQVDWEGCISCHEDAGEEYTIHGRVAHADDEEIPTCSDCHGGHDILPSTAKLSRTNPINLPETCGSCHTDLDLIERHQIRTDHPPDIYESSIHGRAVKGGLLTAATCNDCHSGEGTAHRIYSQGHPNSSINHFNIPDTCGQCHEQSTKDYWAGIHGQLIKRGDANSPVCTNCHGEHGIIAHDDPRSPVSRARLAESTCTPCHQSITLTERYGISTGRRPSFIDNYHGLKTKAGDLEVANCASCHGVHLILPSSNPASRVNADNLRNTCGECHPGITSELAATPIHGFVEGGEESKVAGIVRIVYILAIIVIIGLMALHWIIDLWRQIVNVMRKPQVRRMWADEVWQHTLLMVSFIVLVITGFSLRYGDSWYATLLFGWDYGFTVRGIIHRVAAVVMVVSTLWHLLYLFSRRGRRFLKDMMPNFDDFRQFVQRILYNLGLSKKEPRFKRFSYVEKAEYWALVWGNAVMIITGFLLWFDNFFVSFLPKEFLEVALVIHFYEAILATLAIVIWHLYSTVFNPHVYPMNPSWLTGKMPRDMFEHEHPDAEAEEVKK